MENQQPPQQNTAFARSPSPGGDAGTPIKPLFRNELVGRPRRRIGWKAIVLAGILASLGLFLAIGVFINPPDIKIPLPGARGQVLSIKTPKSPGLPPDMVLLVMGVDSNNNGNPNSFEGVRTDTIMLVRISPDKNTVSVVSIPRDSKVYIGNRRGIDKINAAYAYGGAELTLETLENTFGIPADHYLVINARGIRELVDALGGVTLYVEKPMRYHDRTAKLHIDFDKGHHHMNGAQVEGYLRFRHDELGDIGRIRRQQNFVAALSEKLKSPWILTQLPSLISLSSQYVDTNLSYQQMLQLAWFGKDLDMSRIRVATLPGHPSGGAVSYWLISADAAEEVLDRLILDNPGLLETDDPDRPLRVGILYPPALADRLAPIEKQIQQRGFRVICKTQKANRTSQIIEHSRRVNDRSTNRLRRADGRLENARLIFAPVGTTFEMNTCSTGEDYTVILGEDIGSQRSEI